MKKEIVRLVEGKLRMYPTMRRQVDGGAGGAAALWCAVVEAELEELREDGQEERARLVELRYFEGRSERAVQEALPISASGYKKWRADIIATVAAKAAYRRLLCP